MIIHKNFMASRRNTNPYTGFLKKENSHTARMLIPSRSDQVEISDEALHSFQQKQIIEIEKARTGKVAKQYYPLVKDLIGRDADLRNVIRLESIKQGKENIADRDYPWKDPGALEELAAHLIVFL